MKQPTHTIAQRGALPRFLTVSTLALVAVSCSDAPEDAAQVEGEIDMSFADTTATGTEAVVASGGESCNAPTARRWIGWPASGDVMAQLREAVEPVEVDFVQADEQPATGDSQHLNVQLDADGNITAAICG